MKKIGPCKVIRKFGANAYEIELPDGIEISPISMLRICTLTKMEKQEQRINRKRFSGLNKFL